MRWLLILLLCSAAFAQGPRLVQSEISDAGTSTAIFDANSPVTAGNLLVACSVNGSTSVSDTLANTWTAGTPNVNGAFVSSNMFWTISGSSGADTITQSNASGIITALELSGVSATTDGTASNQNNGATSTSLNVTTAFNGSLIVGCLADIKSEAEMLPTPPAEFGAVSNRSGALAMATLSTALAGTYNLAWNMNNTLHGAFSAVAFKPSAMSVTNAQLKDGSTSGAYSETLKAVGGSGAYTWSITAGSLQTGLSLNASTGAITGTPSSSSLNSITFHVTDGTTSANKTLNLRIDTSFNAISVVQTKTGFSGFGNGFTFTSPVSGGNCIVFSMYGLGRHDSQGYIPSDPALVDSFGTSFKRLTPIDAVGRQTGVSTWVGKIPQCSAGGSDTVNFLTTGLGSGLNINGAEISGMQCSEVDIGTYLNSITTAGSTSSVSITSTLPNEKLLTAMVTPGTATSLTPSGSFTSIITSTTLSGAMMDSATFTATSPGSNSVSYTLSPNDAWGLELIGLLPSVPGATTNCAPAYPAAQVY